MSKRLILDKDHYDCRTIQEAVVMQFRGKPTLFIATVVVLSCADRERRKVR
jgi:hypothetical protein